MYIKSNLALKFEEMYHLKVRFASVHLEINWERIFDQGVPTFLPTIVRKFQLLK